MKLNPYYTNQELKDIGFRSLGRQVLISRTCRIYTPDTISIGSHVLIDDFTILNGDITIGNHVHISSNCEFYAGEASITIGDFSGISSRCAFYATSDDFSGASLNNPTVPKAFRFEKNLPITLGKHVLIGTGCSVMPGVDIGEGCSFGSMTLINKSTEPWGIYVGTPARRIREREQGLLEFEKKLTGGSDAGRHNT
ncbi:MAG: acyltransferase [Oscillospiraceae bacterium]|nr:acyltransferase [Oscillospiraceae bacterium]